MFAPIFEKVRALGLEQRVTFTGYVPDEDAPALMSAARMFVFPSLYEGFGLPVLEAMQTGTPVVCSNASSLPEVAGEAALLFDPRDTAAMARAMREMWHEPALRQKHAVLGLQRSTMFSWQRAAQQTMQVYETVAGAP
jgi:alpha-1,3-rhamnosyl/mannosyltransferase